MSVWTLPHATALLRGLHQIHEQIVDGGNLSYQILLGLQSLVQFSDLCKV